MKVRNSRCVNRTRRVCEWLQSSSRHAWLWAVSLWLHIYASQDDNLRMCPEGQPARESGAQPPDFLQGLFLGCGCSVSLIGDRKNGTEGSGVREPARCYSWFKRIPNTLHLQRIRNSEVIFKISLDLILLPPRAKLLFYGLELCTLLLVPPT